MTDKTKAAAPQWHFQVKDGCNLLTLSGNWESTPPDLPQNVFATASRSLPLVFDTTSLGPWNSSLIAFLWDVKRNALQVPLEIQAGGLPPSARKLVELLTSAPAASDILPPEERLHIWAALRRRILEALTEVGALSEMAWALARRAGAALLGRTFTRKTDLISDIRNAGPSALLIVAVVNFLVGSILAFVGAVQLRKFAADAYVANLVAIAMAREMASVMTAIIMAGRTGGAYAARIATMQSNEEIDALDVFGIPINDYIVIPSVWSLIFTMPLLYLYGCAIGIMGGLCVSVLMLDVTALGYWHQVFGAVGVDQFIFGLFKSACFAAMIGVTSCRIGLKAGRSAADVGQAATHAVVVGIVGVIALDAVFAVMADILGV